MRRLELGVTVVLLAVLGYSTAQAQAEGDPQRGGQLFVENCAVCHGVDGQGRIGASLQQFSGIDPAAVASQTIAQGISGSVMPSWGIEYGGPLTDQDIADIVSYALSAFGGTQPIEPLPQYQPPDLAALPDVQGDPAAGAVVYWENCRPCHGDSGEGRIGKPLATSWPGPQPDQYIRQVVGSGIPGTRMPTWAQSNGGPLSDSDIANVAAFVLSFTASGSAPAPTTEPGPIGVSTVLIVLGGLIVLGIIVGVMYYRRA